ncbi:PREDICTED: auxin-responsive protein SAUR15-like [Camelina sativa]|uniref:Auxin-responsive protein SAUR15-like n=1 Tax=Camelina sativa TaxID=90675 RepID=A0ABM1R8T8_CAMSA|nr:PREDICTED: auxin-responsive protein SAUR15-like [Camelina sativa]
MRSLVKKLLWCGAKNYVSPRTSALPEEGRVRVYVGKDKESQCKLEVEANLLNHPMFEDLLRLSEEEFGHSYEGALRIACEIDVFIKLINLHKTTNHHNPSLCFTHNSTKLS